MPILRNKTQTNFTMISNKILRDKDLSLKDRGLICTLMSLPDSWNFSLAGLATILRDGKDSIRASLNSLEKLGYIKKYQARNDKGQFETILEILPERNDCEGDDNGGFTASENPTRVDQRGEAQSEKPIQYNNDHLKNKANNEIENETTTNDVVVEAHKLFSELNLSDKDIKAILRAANNNIISCQKALSILKHQTSPINNVVGWLINATKQEYNTSAYNNTMPCQSVNVPNREQLKLIENLYLAEVINS